MAMVTAKVMRPAPSLRSRAPALAVPDAVVKLIDKLIERDPADRYQSAAEVLAAIDACLTPPPVVVPAKRTFLRPITIASIAGVLAIVGAAAAWKFTSSDAPATIVVAAAPSKETPPPPMMTQQPDRPTIESPVVEPADVETAKPTSRRHHTRSTRTVEARALPPTTTTDEMIADPPASAPAPAAPAKDTPTPARTTEARGFTAHVAGVEVSGSLSRAHIARAIDRIAPAIASCRASTAGAATITFTVGESRRAESIAVAGPSRSATETSCLASAFAGIRTETVPDVGDAKVTVEVRFR